MKTRIGAGSSVTVTFPEQSLVELNFSRQAEINNLFRAEVHLQPLKQEVKVKRSWQIMNKI